MESRILEYEYTGLRKVISGGQIGADMGGIAAAKLAGIQTGGYAPSGWITCRGPMPALKQLYGLHESTGGYSVRTVQNVQASDGTVIFASDVKSPGTALTIDACLKKNKPVHIFGSDDLLYEWILDYRISVLNIAGNRDRKASKHFDLAFHAISVLLSRLQQENLIVKESINN